MNKRAWTYGERYAWLAGVAFGMSAFAFPVAFLMEHRVHGIMLGAASVLLLAASFAMSEQVNSTRGGL